ncbi:MAG: hypothetical protein K0Q72_2262 [Armatimonadetes bacterium]|jgi:hypothetical protein|nr:hypothetical protein [Armatimonadota bacterium]
MAGHFFTRLDPAYDTLWTALRNTWTQEHLQAQGALRAGSEALEQYWQSRGCIRCLHEYLSSPQDLSIETVQQKLANWQNPAKRRPDRFYCQAHTVPGEAVVARWWHPRELLAGHLAWAFQLDPWNYAYYSQQSPNTVVGPHLLGSYGAALLSPTTTDSGYDYRYTLDARTTLTEACYGSYKAWTVDDANLEGALLTLLRLVEAGAGSEEGKSHEAAYHVLRAYGAKNLPELSITRWTARPTLVWYQEIDAAEVTPASPPKAPPQKVSSPESAGRTNAASRVSKLRELLSEIRDARCAVLLDGVELSIDADASSAVERLAGLDRGLLRDLRQKAQAALREAVQRREIWDNPSARPRKGDPDYPIHFSVNLDTREEWVDAPEWNRCNDAECPENCYRRAAKRAEPQR